MTEEAAGTPADVLKFWWDAGPEAWVRSDPAFDDRVRTVLGPAAEAAASGRLDAWAETPHGALARILLLDQVPRNIHRGTPAAFAADALALDAARAAIEAGYPDVFPKSVRVFFYLPFEHAEDLEAQAFAVDRIRPLDREGHFYALMHFEAIARFGRFPHRNAILGRETTRAEAEWLASGGFKA
jgi:uncharacterized protein (DUF924 family)